jgi:phytol kinase
MMCGGDGIADIVGRRIKSAKLFHSPEKSVAGSISVFVGGFLLSAAILAIYVMVGAFAGPFSRYIFPLFVIALVGMLVESLPQKDVDNVTLTIASAILGYFLF